MSEWISTALGRALAYCCEIGDGSLEGFVDRAAWELYSSSGRSGDEDRLSDCALEFASLAVIIKRGDGTSFVGRPKDLATLPVETLLGMLVEEGGARLTCRVRDHALDTLRFIDARFRTSIVIRITVPKSLLVDGQSAIWFGLQGVANPKAIQLAQSIADTTSRWFVTYASVLVSVRLLSERISGLRARQNQMTALAHDVKAPVGALKYLISDVAFEHPRIHDDTKRLQEELSYVEQLLLQFAPRGGLSNGAGSLSLKQRVDTPFYSGSDIYQVVSRVCERFAPESEKQGNRCIINTSAKEGCKATIPELDLERVLSNVIGNGVRYSGPGEISISIKAGGSERIGRKWIITVSDSGPGIPQRVIDQIALGLSVERSFSARGWGVGLVACKSVLVSHGGDLKIDSSNRGATVEIIVQAANFSGSKLAASPAIKNPYNSYIESTRATACERTPNISVESPFFGDSYVCENVYPTRSSLAPVGGSCLYSDPTNEETGEPQANGLIIVDDDLEHTKSLERLVVKRCGRVIAHATVESALVEILKTPGIAVLCDVNMPDGGAERLLQRLATVGRKARLAVMSGESNDQLLYRFAALGAREFFSKPIDLEGLIRWVKGC